MDAQLLSGLAAAIGTMMAGAAGWFARKKIAAQAEKALAERDSVIVKSATGAVQLANAQMASLLNEQERMRHTIEEYKDAVEKATRAEVSLRLELGKVRKRVQDLEDYIKKNGLAVPEQEEIDNG